VWFAYNSTLANTEDTDSVVPSSEPHWVLKDISFDVRPGERVGIVGATGSGKTTLINLLLRFYDVSRGRITVDGVDIRALDPVDLRGLFSLVLQDVHLFSGTVTENIRLGEERIDESQVLRRFVYRHPLYTAEAIRAQRHVGTRWSAGSPSHSRITLLSTFLDVLPIEQKMVVVDASAFVDRHYRFAPFRFGLPLACRCLSHALPFVFHHSLRHSSCIASAQSVEQYRILESWAMK
jgi:ABC-type siderophore export system fused ATPase/permease subunit